MTRLQRFLHSVASSYVRLVADSVYQLASVPLALHYLSKEEFGLWILILQMTGYLKLIDFGMTSAVARKLIDYKDQRDGGEYGSLLQTGGLVFAIQGIFILLVGLLLSPSLAALLRIPETLRPEFVALMRWYCVLQALTFGTRILDPVLFAHQRVDVSNYAIALQQPVCFLIVWVSLREGQGLNSILWTTLAGWLLLVAVQGGSCARLKLLPRRGAWGRASWQKFHGLFSFGRDAFLVGAGQQLLMASQTFIITRHMGLAVAATWSICTKAYVLTNLLVSRMADFSMPVFSEMLVRGERDRLRKRLQELLILSGTMAGAAGVLFALCNQPFVTVWTKGRIAWSVSNDVLLAGEIVLLALSRGHCSFIPATGRFGFLRYVYLIEGLVFVVIGSLGVRLIGIPALIVASMVCTVSFSGLYGFWHTAHYGGFSLRDVLVRWQIPMLKVILFLAPLGLIAWWLCRCLSPALRLLVEGFWGVIVGCYVLVRYGMPRSLQEELVNRLPSRIRGVLRRWVVVP